MFSVEYVVLDQNLNKVTSGNFVEGVYKNPFKDAKIKMDFARKIGNELIFGFYDKTYWSVEVIDQKFISRFTNIRYRKINLTDFSISKEFVFKHNKRIPKTYQTGDKIKMREFEDNQRIFPTKGGSFLLLSRTDRKQDYEDVKSFTLLDTDFNKLWSVKINQNKDKPGHYYYKTSDDKVLIIKKVSLDRRPDAYDRFYIYNLASGDLIGQFVDTDPKYRMINFQVKILGDHVIFYNRVFSIKNKRYYNEDQLGYARIVIDKNTGKELSRNFLLWKGLGHYFDFKNEHGSIRKLGKLFLEEFVPLENGHTLVIAEGYETRINSRIYNLFTMEFDKNFDVVYFHEIKKKPTKFKKVYLVGSDLYYYGYFSYLYHQKLNDSEDYVFFYKENDKKNNILGRRYDDPLWYLGIITYVDGSFHYDQLKLTKKNAQIIPARAKNGSILLQEIKENGDTQIRLERVNY